MYAIYWKSVNKVLAANDQLQLGFTSIPPCSGCKVKKFVSPKDAINFLHKTCMKDMLGSLSIAPYPPSPRLKARRNPATSQAAREAYLRGEEEGGNDSPFSHFAGFEGA